MSSKCHGNKTVRSSALTPSRPVSLNLGYSFDDPARRFPWHAVLVVIAMAVLAYIAVCAYGALAGV
jgi:hypothetical protein